MPTISVAGKTWTYEVHAGLTPRAIVIAIHGAGGNGRQMAEMTRLHEQNANAVVCYPTAQPTFLWWIPNWLPANRARDTAFLAALVDRLKTDWGGLPVYVVGHSAGATMAYRVACELGPVTRLVATAAGLNPTDATKAPTDLWHVHGNDDTIVPFETYTPSIKAGIRLLKDMGCSIKITRLSNVGHDVWGAVPELPLKVLGFWGLL